MFSIRTMNKISPEGLSRFEPGAFTCSDDAQKPDALMVRSASLHEMEMPSSVKAIARAGAGVNNIPVDQCSKEGIVVFNTPGANANAVKELVLGAMIFSARNVINAVEWAKTLKGSGAEVGKLVEKGKSKFAGPELSGKKLGVIGLGAIGVMVANDAHSLGMEVYGFDPYISVDAAWGISRAINRANSMKEIFEKCDFITIHVPLNPETRGTFNAEAFAAMKKGVRLFNFARGELAVSEDVAEALASGQVASYTVDFPCDELLGVPGVISIPHLGASTPESENNCASMAADELIQFLKTGTIRNSVNFPNADMAFSSATRITVIHKNIPNMLSQISTAFAQENINIENMLNKSKKEYAYTMLDIDGEAIDKAVEKLRAIDGIIRVRVIR
ncbi:MAG TPA: phosphoglycerate dehydrogenase [Clostridia bacterium]|nr:phosphoglycerate dehydrogenase [Clostridia bacterium]